jgi:hypothetical protein
LEATKIVSKPANAAEKAPASDKTRKNEEDASDDSSGGVLEVWTDSSLQNTSTKKAEGARAEENGLQTVGDGKEQKAQAKAGLSEKQLQVSSSLRNKGQPRQQVPPASAEAPLNNSSFLQTQRQSQQSQQYVPIASAAPSHNTAQPSQSSYPWPPAPWVPHPYAAYYNQTAPGPMYPAYYGAPMSGPYTVGQNWGHNYGSIPPQRPHLQNLIPNHPNPHNSGPNRAMQQFASRTSSTPVRFPAANITKSSALRIPDDSDETTSIASQAPAQRSTGAVHDASRAHNEKRSLLVTDTKDSTYVPSQALEQETSSSSRPKRATAARPVVYTETDPQVASPSSRPKRSTAGKAVVWTEAERPKRSTAGKRKAWAGPDQEYVPPSPRQLLSKVKDVAAWEFPAGVTDKWQYINSSIKEGRDATVLFEATVEKPSSRSRRGRRKQVSENSDVAKDKDGDRQLVTEVEFDTRLLQYDTTPLGSLDRLVRPSIVKASGKPSDDFLRKVPDPPILSKSSSRLGPRYQARVARYGEFRDKRGEACLAE